MDVNVDELKELENEINEDINETVDPVEDAVLDTDVVEDVNEDENVIPNEGEVISEDTLNEDESEIVNDEPENENEIDESEEQIQPTTEELIQEATKELKRDLASKLGINVFDENAIVEHVNEYARMVKELKRLTPIEAEYTTMKENQLINEYEVPKGNIDKVKKLVKYEMSINGYEFEDALKTVKTEFEELFENYNVTSSVDNKSELKEDGAMRFMREYLNKKQY